MKPFVIVIGPAKHGKSTFRKALAEALDVRGASCSGYLYALWAYLDGTKGPEYLQELPKDEVRPKLVALGDWMTTAAMTFSERFPFDMFPGFNPSVLERTPLPRPHPGALIQTQFADGVGVLDGVRRKRELDAALPHFAWFNIKPLVVWVEDPRKGRDPADNLDLTMDDAQLIVINRGSVEDLQGAARDLAQEILSKSDLDA